VRPDVLLSDISLAESLSGVDLAERLRALHPGLPVVLMTGYSDQLERAAALGLTVLAKPVGSRELLNVLAAALAAGGSPDAAGRGSG
jgi:two-component system NtrC family sensor kinase